MKLLITGSAGLLGKNLFESFSEKYEVFGISRKATLTTTHQFDLTSNGLESLLGKINPDILIHCAALTNVDYCEVHEKEAYAINVASTEGLSKWAESNGRKMIYLSTDYVYPGKTNKYDEDSEVEPLNIYGNTKLLGELSAKKVKNHTILRTTGLFGYDPEGLNFLMQMLNLKVQRKIPSDMYGNPTSVDLMTSYIQGVIEKDLQGVYVASGPETLDRYSFALLISEVFNLNRNLIYPCLTKDVSPITLRPLLNGTNSSRIKKELGLEVPGLINSLKSIRSKL